MLLLVTWEPHRAAWAHLFCSPYLQANQHVIKYSDDTAILSLLTHDSDISSQWAGIDTFVEGCNEHHLRFNVKKTEEMVFDPPSIGDHSPISINGENIKQVSYKYLGVYIDNMLSWQIHISNICSRIDQHHLRIFGVSRNIMMIFYRAAIESVLHFGRISWFEWDG